MLAMLMLSPVSGWAQTPFDSTAASADTLSMERAVQIGLDQNYGIRIAKNEREIAGNNNTYGNAGFLPTVDATGNYSKRIENSNTAYSSNSIPDRNITGAESTTKNASVSLNWTVFDGLKMFASKERLDQLEEQSREQLQASVEATVANIIRSYTQIIQLQKTVAVLENTLEVSAKRIDIAQTKLDLGSGSEYELLQAQTAYNADQAALLQGKNDLHNAKVELNRLLSRDPDMEFAVFKQIDVNTGLELPLLTEDALQSNTELSIARINEKVTRQELKEIQAERMPEVGLQAGYGWTKNESGAGFVEFSKTDGFNVGVTARINIFDGLNVNRRIQNAEVQIRNQELRQSQLQDQIRSDLLTAYSSYQQGIQLIELEEENLEIAKRSLDIALERFELGTINFIELREAQRTYISAQSRLITAQYQAKSAETELLRLSGQLVR
jgi:outer membrane protein